MNNTEKIFLDANAVLNAALLPKSYDDDSSAESCWMAEVEGLVVVETKDTVLIAAKDKAQHIKTIVKELKARDRSEHITHREVFRPWGSYDSIDIGGRYQVKRITVKPMIL